MGANTLLPLVRGYLESAGFKIIEEQRDSLVADKLVFGQDRITWIVWAVPGGGDVTSHESALRPSISGLRENYPEAKGYVVTHNPRGFSKDFQKSLSEARVEFPRAPIQFFDAAFKVEVAPQARSAIEEIRSLDVLKKRVPQPFSTALSSQGASQGPDLFDTLLGELKRGEGPAIRIVIGRAGIGKSVLFRSLFACLYDEFLQAKNKLAAGCRPIPLLPEHLRDSFAARTELLVESFLRTDVASPVARETFEWLLANGFTTWLLDGLDELYGGDPYFFEYLADLVTRRNSRAQITIWCRDSLLTTSDAFAELEDLCRGTAILKVYQLSEWERPSKRQFAWLGLEGRGPRLEEPDTGQVETFLRRLDQSTSLRAISGLPFYCEVLLRQFHEGQLQDFEDDISMLDHVIDQMLQREVAKGLLDLRYFESRGLDDWLEEIAVSYVDGRYADLNKEVALEYGRLVLRDGVDEKTKDHLLITLLQFPLFRGGSESGRIAFAHDLVADAIAARRYARLLIRLPMEVARQLARTDLGAASVLRFMARKLDDKQEAAIAEELKRGRLHGREYVALLSLILMARPQRDLVKRLRCDFEARDLAGVRFAKRDLSGISFRRADVSNAVFQDCDLRDAQFEGAFFQMTGFEGENQLEGARFGDLARVQSLVVGKKHLEESEQIRQWAANATGRAEPVADKCPSALQLVHLFGKFVTPLGEPKRDDLKLDAIKAGKRYSGAAPIEECVEESLKLGYLTGPDYRGRYRRAEGDKYAEVVKLVRDGSISQGLGQLLAKTCRIKGCTHRLQS